MKSTKCGIRSITKQNCSTNKTERTGMTSSDLLNMISLEGARTRIPLGGFLLLDTSYSIQDKPNEAQSFPHRIGGHVSRWVGSDCLTPVVQSAIDWASFGISHSTSWSLTRPHWVIPGSNNWCQAIRTRPIVCEYAHLLARSDLRKLSRPIRFFQFNLHCKFKL